MSEAKRRSGHIYMRETQAWFDRNAAGLMVAAKDFVDKFIRQNTSALVDKIGIEARNPLPHIRVAETVCYHDSPELSLVGTRADGGAHPRGAIDFIAKPVMTRALWPREVGLRGFLQSLMACEGLGLDLREGGKAFCRLDGFRVSCFGIWVFSCL